MVVCAFTTWPPPTCSAGCSAQFLINAATVAMVLAAAVTMQRQQVLVRWCGTQSSTLQTPLRHYLQLAAAAAAARLNALFLAAGCCLQE